MAAEQEHKQNKQQQPQHKQQAFSAARRLRQTYNLKLLARKALLAKMRAHDHLFATSRRKHFQSAFGSPETQMQSFGTLMPPKSVAKCCPRKICERFATISSMMTTVDTMLCTCKKFASASRQSLHCTASKRCERTGLPRPNGAQLRDSYLFARL